MADPMPCTLVHDRAFLNAMKTWDAAYHDPSMTVEEKATVIDGCCEILDERVIAHGSDKVPRPLLAFCTDLSCAHWASAARAPRQGAT